MIVTAIKTTPKALRFSAFLEVDTDTNSNRIQLFDRRTGVLCHHQRTLGGVIKSILPLEYSIVANITCVLLDDDNEFDGAVFDNVKCIQVDLSTFDPKNPLPYEP